MSDARSEFVASTTRLARAARGNLLISRSITGLFFGLLPALGVAILAGTVTFPVPAPFFAAAGAVAGLAAGALSALLSRLDRVRLLIKADSVLGSRELASTALELSAAVGGEPDRFTTAILEDASRLLSRTSPRAIVGRPRQRLAPFAALAAILTAGALLFPLNLRALFAASADRDRAIAQMGEDLRQRGERLAEKAQSQGLDRSLELSRQLAQLGSDLAARRIAPQDALDRMSELESGLAHEYQLRVEQLAAAPSGTPGPASDARGKEAGTSADGRGKSGEKGRGEAGSDSSTERGGDGTTGDLADALDKLRQAQRELRGQVPGQIPSQVPGQDDRAQDRKGPATSPGGAGPGAQPGEKADGGIGTLPAPRKRGPPSSIVEGDKGPSLQIQGDAAGEETTRLLARSLPERSGSRLPEQAILNQYARQAESALEHDQVPLKLRQSVKEYFTVIGVSK